MSNYEPFYVPDPNYPAKHQVFFMSPEPPEPEHLPIEQWASMEADSGGNVPKVGSEEWRQLIEAVMYYHLLSCGHEDSVYLRLTILHRSYFIKGRQAHAS